MPSASVWVIEAAPDLWVSSSSSGRVSADFAAAAHFRRAANAERAVRDLSGCLARGDGHLWREDTGEHLWAEGVPRAAGNDHPAVAVAYRVVECAVTPLNPTRG